MIKALWFLIKAGLFIGLAIWIAERPGSVHIEWMSYDLTIKLGFFLLMIAALVIAAMVVHAVISLLLSIPSRYKSYRGAKDHEKGYQALTRGLSASAAGDLKQAARESRRMQKYLDGKSHPLMLLLQAQVARMEGEPEVARAHFTTLLESKDGAFIGIRGLLGDALDRRDYNEAQRLIEKALRLYPKHDWIIEAAYGVYIHQENWSAARRMLKRGLKHGVFTAAQVHEDEAAMLLIQADAHEHSGDIQAALSLVKKAHKAAPDFLPATLELARLYTQADKRRHAVTLIQKVWQTAPHPDLAKIWLTLVPRRGQDKPAKRLSWAEKLVVLNPDAADSHLLAGRIAMEQSLWGPAKTYLERAESLRAGKDVYFLLAERARRSGGDAEEIKAYEAKAESAPPSYAWVCSETGRIYERWQPFSPVKGGAFNTIRWQKPRPLYVYGVSSPHDDLGLPSLLSVKAA